MIEMTQNAAKAVRRFVASSPTPKGGLRVAVKAGGCAGFKYNLDIAGEPGADDMTIEQHGVKVFLDPESLALVDGMTLDFVETIHESGFQFSNPNASSACSCGKSFGA